MAALAAENLNSERALDARHGSDDLAPEPEDDAKRQIAPMPRRKPAQNLRLAAGPERNETARAGRARLARLGFRDLDDQFRPLHQQVVNGVVDCIDLLADIGERFLRAGRLGRHARLSAGRAPRGGPLSPVRKSGIHTSQTP